MSDTPIAELPELDEAQSEKFLIHNEALRRLEAMLFRVLSRSVSDAYGLSPSDGDAWIVNRASFDIVDIDSASEIVYIGGDKTARFTVGDTFRIANSSANNGTYTLSAVSYDSGADQTALSVEENIQGTISDGEVLHSAGAFNGHYKEIAFRSGGGWLYATPFEGLGPLWVNDEDIEVIYNGDWVQPPAGAASGATLEDAGGFFQGSDANAALRQLGVVVHLAVESRTSDEPGTPTDGSRYIHNGGTWSVGSAGDVIARIAGAWYVYTPADGWTTKVLDEGLWLEYSESAGDWTIPPVSAPKYTVANLPAAGTAARMAYATDGRKNGETAGNGTGVLVFDDGTDWIAVDSGQAVAA